jgi:S-formylglutathione hydrolase FrmB
MKYGMRYYTYLTKEIPYIASTYFPISTKREDNFIAGLSMGGYGAFMIALRNPEMFCKAASLSGAVDLLHIFDLDDLQAEPTAKLIFGSKQEYLRSDYNIIKLIKKQKESGANLPKLYQCCGTEDFLYPANQSFKAAAMKYGLDLTYDEGPGVHNWDYWDANIQKVLKWLFNEKSDKI